MMDDGMMDEGTRELVWVCETLSEGPWAWGLRKTGCAPPSSQPAGCDESDQKHSLKPCQHVQRFRGPLPVSGSLFGRSECRWPTALLAAETSPYRAFLVIFHHLGPSEPVER